MSNIFYISDTHFSHSGVCKFENNGVKDRPWDDPLEMDEALIKNWNSVVKPHDKVIVCGDVAMKKQYIQVIGRCNGKKKLLLGNHDIFDLREYTPYFYEIAAYRVDNKNKFIAAHIPIHPASLSRWDFMVHGHLHTHNVLLDDGRIDPRYVSVCVEKINFTPIEQSEVISIAKKQKEEIGL